jgi:hypothetical protein
VIGTIITALALQTVNYLVLTREFLLSAVPEDCCRGPDKADFNGTVFELDSTSSSSEDDEKREGVKLDKQELLAEREAVLPFIEAEILKHRPSIHPDYDTSRTYFVRPFGVVMDIVAGMDVVLHQCGPLRSRNKRIRM